MLAWRRFCDAGPRRAPSSRRAPPRSRSGQRRCTAAHGGRRCSGSSQSTRHTELPVSRPLQSFVCSKHLDFDVRFQATADLARRRRGAFATTADRMSADHDGELTDPTRCWQFEGANWRCRPLAEVQACQANVSQAAGAAIRPLAGECPIGGTVVGPRAIIDRRRDSRAIS